MVMRQPSTVTTTQLVMGWPSSSVPTSTASSRLATTSPSGPSFIHFTSGNVVARVPLDGKLSIHRACQGRVAGAAGIDPAVMDNDHGAVERLSHGICCLDVGRHVLI